eukprot:7015687-Alexandrium_andersonii.AAC.1
MQWPACGPGFMAQLPHVFEASGPHYLNTCSCHGPRGLQSTRSMSSLWAVRVVHARTLPHDVSGACASCVRLGGGNAQPMHSKDY